MSFLFFLVMALAPATATVTPTLPLHEYHVSKTNLRFVAERDQLQVEMHLFVDDLELAIQDAGGPRLYLGTEKELPQSGRILASYLEKHFRVTYNDTMVVPTVMGYELDDDMHGFWIYLAAEVTEAPRAVAVRNSLLTEYYPDQKNITKLFRADERLATLLTSRDRPREVWSR